MNSPSTVAILLILTVAAAKQTQLRVLHGVEDVHNEFPYVVSLLIAETSDHIHYRSIRRLCTGTLIAPTWVLTASHCLIHNLWFVRYGNMTTPHGETKTFSKVLRQIYHPGYSERMHADHKEGFQNDIGLVMVKTIHMTPGKVSAVDYKTLIGMRVRYAGFGDTFNRDDDTYHDNIDELLALDAFKPLQIGEGVVVMCLHDEKLWGPAVCVSAPCSNKKADSAYGDSGGPLFYNGRVVAVTSGGSPEASKNVAEAILTPVSPYLSWMRAVMSEGKNVRKKNVGP